MRWDAIWFVEQDIPGRELGSIRKIGERSGRKEHPITLVRIAYGLD